MRKLLLFLLFSTSVYSLSLKNAEGELLPAAKNFIALFDISPDLPTNQLVTDLKIQWIIPNKERWEMDPLFEEKKKLAYPLLKKLGCIDPICATKNHYTYALVLGAMEVSMKKRLDFLYEEWQRGVRFDEIVLLTGDRDLDPQRESVFEAIHTKADLLVYLFEHHPVSKCAPYTLIDTEKEKLADGKLRRPTTASTITRWMERCPPAGSCLAISSQPFIGYQEAVSKLFLSNGFTVEAVGPGGGASPLLPYNMSVYLDNFAKWLLYEHLTELKCEELSPKGLFDSAFRN